MSVEVADGESALEISSAGEFAGSWTSEGEYGLLASEGEYDAGLPLSPEQAVRFATERTGRRAAGVPVAIMIHPGNYGNRMPAKCMRWRIPLESPRRLRGRYGDYEVADVFVRRERYCEGPLVLQVADTQQPTLGTIEYPVFLGGGPERIITEKVTVRFVLPMVYDAVVVIP